MWKDVKHSSAADEPEWIQLPPPHKLTNPLKLYAGANHFLIHSPRTKTLYSFGDNRFGQTGQKAGPLPLSVPRSIDLLEGLELISIAVGDVHCAVVDDQGGCYVWGSNTKLQCGEMTSSDPELVVFEIETDEEMPDALAVGCGSRHTIILTNRGVYAAGDSQSISSLSLSILLLIALT